MAKKITLDGVSLFTAVENNDPILLARLLACGHDLEMRCARRRTPASWACAYNHPDCLRVLLDAGCDIEPSDHCDETPLHLAAFNGTDCIDMLLKAGASTRAANRHGQTPFILAIIGNEPATLIRLAQAGADIEARDKNDATALHMASNHSSHGARSNCLKALIELGCDIDARDKNRRTGLMRAAHDGRDDSALILCDAGCATHLRDNKRTTALDIARNRGMDSTAAIIERAIERAAISDSCAAALPSRAATPRI